MEPKYISLLEAEQMTGLPSRLLAALAESGEVPCELHGSQLYMARAALLGWCRLYGKILTAITQRQPQKQVGISLSARNLVWMTQAGLLAGKDRIRI